MKDGMSSILQTPSSILAYPVNPVHPAKMSVFRLRLAALSFLRLFAAISSDLSCGLLCKGIVIFREFAFLTESQSAAAASRPIFQCHFVPLSGNAGRKCHSRRGQTRQAE